LNVLIDTRRFISVFISNQCIKKRAKRTVEFRSFRNQLELYLPRPNNLKNPAIT